MTEKDYARVMQGKRSKAVGEHFERMIETSCEYYKFMGMATIKKTPEPMKPIKDLGNGRFVAYFEKRAQPDFKGTLRGGRAILFDAKHTDSDRIERKAVSEEQEKEFDINAIMGAECFVLVSFGFREFYKIPWDIFKNMKELFGRKYRQYTPRCATHSVAQCTHPLGKEEGCLLAYSILCFSLGNSEVMEHILLRRVET